MSYMDKILSGQNKDLAMLEWRMAMEAIIKEHRPGTLDAELPALLNICYDAYVTGLENARQAFATAIDSSSAAAGDPKSGTEAKDKANPSG